VRQNAKPARRRRANQKAGVQSTPARAPEGLHARRAALAILSEVLRRKRPFDAVADKVLSAAALPPRDAGFARAIAGETLRRFGQLDAVIRVFVPKSPPPHKAGATLEILLAGACELLFLGVAPHAAVDAANHLAQDDGKAVHFKPLINAVLRRTAREGASLVAAQDAARLDTPDWLWRRWLAEYGEDATRAIAAVHQQIPPLDLTLKPGSDAAQLFPAGAQLAPERVRLTGAGRIETLPGYDAGLWWVQDFAASLPARLFGDVSGKTAIDLCAAPGGKTAQLAAGGARVTAVDVSPERLLLVSENLQRLGLAAELVAGDARDWRPRDAAECVLLDAPCTATGTIRRHPDLPWNKSAADIPATEALQSELLEAAADMTAPKGMLIYAVCSLEPEEGIEQITHFLRRHDDFVRVPIAATEVFDGAFVTPDGDLKTLPSHWADTGGMDGFYAARFRRVT
jgi:16S rRNA (cytosine967-C5)-methyltransferase